MQASPDSPRPANATLHALLSPSLDPVFWGSWRTGVPSAWYGHIPFAHWLVAAHRPAVVVELGTHYGVSHFAFCHSALLSAVPCHCYAVDTWAGDEHAGHYGDDVHESVAAFNAAHCSAVSTLLRLPFDDAVHHFQPGVIDLLHIDGLHTYDAVRHDFETWLPKLSPRAVVLLHDTAVREHDFGVWRLWEELSARYRSFSFHHAYGLGVLAIGEQVTGPVADLCALEGTPAGQTLRDRFMLMGSRLRSP